MSRSYLLMLAVGGFTISSALAVDASMDPMGNNVYDVSGMNAGIDNTIMPADQERMIESGNYDNAPIDGDTFSSDAVTFEEDDNVMPMGDGSIQMDPTPEMLPETMDSQIVN